MSEALPIEHGPAGPPAPVTPVDQRARLEILFAILLGIFLAALDQTIVGTALPVVVGDLRGSDELYTWVVTIYLLTSTITGPFYGKLSDLYGRRPMLMIGIAVFLIGSFLSGLSQSMEQLILFRGLQGLGAGALFPIALAVIGDLFTPAERGRYQGLFGAVFGIAAIVGPLLGGFLTDALSWHWIFFVNLPVGAVTLYMIWRLLPTVRRAGASRNIDYLGAAVFTVAISLFLVGLTNKQKGEWIDPTVGGFIGAGLLLGALFVLIESRAREPIVPLDLWRNRTYTGSMIATFLASFGFFGAAVFLPRWFQFVRGASPTESGLQALALLVGLIAGSVGGGALVSRTGRYKWLMVGSLLVMALGLYLMTNLRSGTDLPVLWLWMAITGLGIGPTLAVFTIVVQNAVPLDRLGVATSNLTFFRQIGGSVGLAIAGTIFGITFREQLPTQLAAAGIPAQFAAQAPALSQQQDVTAVGVDLAAKLRDALPPLAQPFIPNIVAGIREAFSIAIADGFVLGIGGALVAAVVSMLLVRELPLRSVEPERAGLGRGGMRAEAPAPPAA